MKLDQDRIDDLPDRHFIGDREDSRHRQARRDRANPDFARCHNSLAPPANHRGFEVTDFFAALR